jgi:hypothetical protein
MKLTEQWTNQSTKILDKLATLSQEENRDRLAIINALMLALNAMDRSVQGWRKWIQNLDFMARFSEDELKAIEQGLLKSVRNFIEYDIDITKQYQDKLPQMRLTRRRKRKKDNARGMYA